MQNLILNFSTQYNYDFAMIENLKNKQLRTVAMVTTCS